MTILLIEYRMDDYVGWKALFDADPRGRASHGVTRHWIHRDPEDPNHLLLGMAFAAPDQASAFREALAPVWEISGAGQSWILEPTEEVDVVEVDTTDAPDRPKPNHFLYKLVPPRPTFPGDITPAEAEIMEQHFAYWEPFEADGTVVVLGPVLDPAGTWGLGILAADSVDDVLALVADDPPVKTGMTTFEVSPLLDPYVRR